MYQTYTIILFYALICLTGHQATDQAPAPAASPCDVAADAKLIVDNNEAELIVMRIFPFRTPDERKKINEEVRKTGVTPLIDEGTYMPAAPGSLPWKDLCYVLLCQDKNTILSRYIDYFFDQKDENVINNIMIMVDDMPKFIEAFNGPDKKRDFGKSCEKQRHPFSNMLKVWADSPRPADGPVDDGAADKEACALLDEKPKWDETRDELEKVLMKSSYAMSNAIIKKYEDKQKHPIEDDIKGVIKNADLVDTYSSLAGYIKDKYNCLAIKLHERSDSQDYWATWNMMIGTLKPDEWTKINDCFKKNFNVGVVEFISTNILGDFVLMETFAHLIDPSYKPKFLDKPAPGVPPSKPLPPPVVPGGLQPSTVPPTVVLPPATAPPPGTPPPPATPPPGTPHPP